MDEMVLVLTVLLAAFLAAMAQYIFKRGMPRFDMSMRGFMALIGSRQVLLGLMVYAAGLVIYLYALSTSELSFVYPTFASVFVFVLILSKFMLKEQVTLPRALGVAIVIIGIVLVALTYQA